MMTQAQRDWRDGKRMIADGVRWIVQQIAEKPEFWTRNGEEQVASFGYHVVNSEGQVIGRVSTYVHLVEDATPEDFLEGNIL